MLVCPGWGDWVCLTPGELGAGSWWRSWGRLCTLGFGLGTSETVSILCPSLGGQKHVEKAPRSSSRQDPCMCTRAGGRCIHQEKPRSWGLWELPLDLQQPGSGRCAPKTREMGLRGEARRQAPQGRLWRTAMDLHMGRRCAGACGTQMRRDLDEAEAGKEGKFWAYYLHMEHVWARGVGELRMHMYMHERERGRDQPACSSQKQQRQGVQAMPPK